MAAELDDRVALGEPGAAAGVPATAACTTRRRCGAIAPAEAARTGSARPSTPSIGVAPMWIVLEPCPATICVAIESAVLIGIANPWPPLELEAEARRGGRVHADHLAGAVDERAAGVARAAS